MIRRLLYYGHPDLRKRCAKIKEIKEEIRQIAQDLIDTVIEKNGLGLAACQIGSFVRMFVCLCQNGMDDKGAPITCSPKIYINPTLSKPSLTTFDTRLEGSLSIPGLYQPVIRPWEMHLEAMDLDGKFFSESVTGWLARNVMHQNDSLNGVLFIDRLNPKIRKQIEPSLRLFKKNISVYFK